MGHPAPGEGQHTVGPQDQQMRHPAPGQGPQFLGAPIITLAAEGRLQREGWRLPGEERGWGSSGVRGGEPLLLVGRTETYLSPGCGEVSGAVQEQARGRVCLGLPPACPGPLRLKRVAHSRERHPLALGVGRATLQG